MFYFFLLSEHTFFIADWFDVPLCFQTVVATQQEHFKDDDDAAANCLGEDADSGCCNSVHFWCVFLDTIVITFACLFLIRLWLISAGKM